MESQLHELLSLQQRDKAPAYTALLHRSLDSTVSTADDICLLVSTVVNEEQVGLVVARQVLTELSKAIPANNRQREWKQKLIENVLRVLQPRLVSFEEYDEPCLLVILLKDASDKPLLSDINWRICLNQMKNGQMPRKCSLASLLIQEIGM